MSRAIDRKYKIGDLVYFKSNNFYVLAEIKSASDYSYSLRALFRKDKRNDSSIYRDADLRYTVTRTRAVSKEDDLYVFRKMSRKEAILFLLKGEKYEPNYRGEK